MLKRAFTAATFALAMVALNGTPPTEISAQEAVREADAGGGTCAVYCLSCQTHHLIAC